MPKLLIYDTETTGVDSRKHCIHQLTGMLLLNNDEPIHFNYKIAPHPNAHIDPEALKVGNVSLEQIQSYKPSIEVFKEFKSFLNDYVDPFDKKDKIHLVGYNNRKFDDDFLRKLFEMHNDKYFGSFFWPDSIDVMVLASLLLKDVRSLMPDFKLATVAKTFKITVDADKLHDAYYDVYLTKLIYDFCLSKLCV